VNILFLTADDVLDLHVDQIAAFGGSPGVRDLGLLQSAVAIPQSGVGGAYAHEFPHGMAAAYLFHVVANHPFVDGNKRTGLAAALLFLESNDYTLAADRTVVGDMVLAVAAGTLDKQAVVDFFKAHVRPA
jgi:death on curing protein